MNNKQKNISKFLGLIKWSLIRHKFYIPIFVLVQIILTFAIIYGFLFITNANDKVTQSYLCTGAIAINVIAVTCVLAPQIVSEAKQNGIYDYQKTLPVSRVGILLSDLLIWGFLCLPGILSSLLISKFGFGLDIFLSLIALVSIILIIFALLSLGFAIAYVFPSNIVSLMTQLIMFGGLMFSPIIFPVERLPRWITNFYQYLPFVPSSQLIRANLFHLEQVGVQQFVVLGIWAILSFTLSLLTLTRRK